MKLYFAPLEGVTTRLFRDVHFKCFGGADLYYSPFITPGTEDKITSKLIKDVLPDENNAPLVPQILCNQPEPFLNLAHKLKEIGYTEINLNLGCPSGTVVGKNRGAGFLRDTDALDMFFEKIFSACPISVSVKTRIGFSDASEINELITVFNRYPISLLTVHPRLRTNFYKGIPDMEAFEEVYMRSSNPVCYNGDICTKEKYENIVSTYPNLQGVMIGRGAIQNPALFREIKDGQKLNRQEMVSFLTELSEEYFALFRSEVFTLHKLKEVMFSVANNFPEDKKFLKQIKKANKLSDIHGIIQQMPEL